MGTPETVADQLEAFFDHVGGDGFMLSPIYCPGAIEELVDIVVPELQRRGRFRTSYTGLTQRHHLLQQDQPPETAVDYNVRNLIFFRRTGDTADRYAQPREAGFGSHFSRASGS